MLVFTQSPSCRKQEKNRKEMPLQLKRKGGSHGKNISQRNVYYDHQDKHKAEPTHCCSYQFIEAIDILTDFLQHKENY